jgi:hypothetical protein
LHPANPPARGQVIGKTGSKRGENGIHSHRYKGAVAVSYAPEVFVCSIAPLRPLHPVSGDEDDAPLPYRYEEAVTISHVLEALVYPGRALHPLHSLSRSEDGTVYPHRHEGALAVGYALEEIKAASSW